MKIPLLLGISLLATVAGKARQPQAEKPPEAPAAEIPTTSPGQNPPPRPGVTQEPDDASRTMERPGENNGTIRCYAAPAPPPNPTPEQAAAMEKSQRALCWHTLRMAKEKSAMRGLYRLSLERMEFKRQMDRYHAEGEKPELLPQMDGTPYFLRPVPIKPAG